MGDISSADGIKYFDRYDMMNRHPICAIHFIASTAHAYETF